MVERAADVELVELAVVPERLPLRIDQERGVVEPVSGALDEAGDDVNVVRLRGGRQPVRVRTGDRLGTVGRRGVVPAEVESIGQDDDAAASGRRTDDHRVCAAVVLVRPASFDEGLAHADKHGALGAHGSARRLRRSGCVATAIR